MRKAKRIVTAAALAAAVLGVAPATASNSCIDGTTFRYCGEHVRLSKLPLRFALNNSGGIAGTNNALIGAIAEWNRAWPRALVGTTGARVEIGRCGTTGTGAADWGPLCYAGTTGAVAGVPDGVNTIGWGNPGGCDGSHAERIAVACLWYEDSAKTKIREVDVILNTTKDWLIADTEVVVGEVQGTFSVRGSVIGQRAEWHDVQSAITHELGHALGLEDIGDEQRKWPANLVGDTPKHSQTMYRWYIQGSTNKRTLGDGDIAGLYLAAWETANDL